MGRAREEKYIEVSPQPYGPVLRCFSKRIWMCTSPMNARIYIMEKITTVCGIEREDGLR